MRGIEIGSSYGELLRVITEETLPKGLRFFFKLWSFRIIESLLYIPYTTHYHCPYMVFISPYIEAIYPNMVNVTEEAEKSVRIMESFE